MRPIALATCAFALAASAGVMAQPAPAATGGPEGSPPAAAAPAPASPAPAGQPRPFKDVAKDAKEVPGFFTLVGSSRVDLQACKLEYSIVSPK